MVKDAYFILKAIKKPYSCEKSIVPTFQHSIQDNGEAILFQFDGDHIINST